MGAGALISLLLPMVPGLVQSVQQLFKKPATPIAPGTTPAPTPVPTGTDKMAAVVQSLRVILDKMIASGAVPAPTEPITDDKLQGAVETIVQQVKSAGQLDVPVPTPTVATAPASAPITGTFVFKGTIIPIGG